MLERALKKIISELIKPEEIEKTRLTPQHVLLHRLKSERGFYVEISYHYQTIIFEVYDVRFNEDEWEKELSYTTFIVNPAEKYVRILRGEEAINFRLREYHVPFFEMLRHEGADPDLTFQSLVILSVLALKNMKGKGKVRISINTDYAEVENLWQIFSEIGEGLLLLLIQGEYKEDKQIYMMGTGMTGAVLKVFYDGNVVSADRFREKLKDLEANLEAYGVFFSGLQQTKEVYGEETYSTLMVMFDIDDTSRLYKMLLREIVRIAEENEFYQFNFQIARSPRRQALHIIGERVVYEN